MNDLAYLQVSVTLAKLIASDYYDKSLRLNCTDIRIIDVWKSACGVMALWHLAWEPKELARTTSIALSAAARAEVCDTLDL